MKGLARNGEYIAVAGDQMGFTSIRSMQWVHHHSLSQESIQKETQRTLYRIMAYLFHAMTQEPILFPLKVSIPGGIKYQFGKLDC